MSIEMWLLLQALGIAKVAVTVGLSGLALVPAVRLMRSPMKRK
jgi:hypothetical protein